MRLSNDEIQRLKEASRMAQEAFSRIPKGLIENAFSFQKMLADFRIPEDMLKQMQKEARQAAGIWRNINLPSMTHFINDIQKTFSNVAWKQFAEQAEQAQKFIKELKLTEKTIIEANEALMKMGWWVYPKWPIPSLKYIADSCREGKSEDVRREIIQFFDKKQLRLMTKDWKQNPKLKHRYKSLKDAVWAHTYKNSKYTLSIPVLLPHIEGIINENSGQEGKITHKKCIAILKEYLDKDLKKDRLSSLYPLAMLRFTEQLLSQSFEWGKPSKKGRHPILHGHYTDYDDEEFSLKLILLIDFLQNIIRKENQ